MKLKPNHDRTEYTGTCDKCNQPVITHRGQGDFTHDCGAIYNAFGQRLRDDLYSRPNRSEWDDECDDMTGYELAMGFDN
jgi:hypothetical protein